MNHAFRQIHPSIFLAASASGKLWSWSGLSGRTLLWMGTGRSACRHLLLSLVLLLTGLPLAAQVIDEDTQPVTVYTGIGEDGNDFLAQSFIADVRQIYRIGAWLRRDSGTADVKLSLVADQGNLPDVSQVLYESPLIQPDSNGAWHIDTLIRALVTPGTRYWILVDGYQNVLGNGYASVGISATFTDTNDPAHLSNNGGNSWFAVPSSPMAIYVEGDTCTFNVNLSPDTHVLCPGETVEIAAPFGYASYAWSTGGTGNTEIFNTWGTYTVTITDQNLCVAVGSVNVLEGLVPTTFLDSLYAICDGEELTLSVPPFYNGYLWSNGETQSTTTVTEAGEYWVNVYSAAGCLRSDTVQVGFLPNPTADIGRDTSLCDGEFLQLDAGPGMKDYLWSSGESTRSIFPTTDGSYWVELTDTNNCTGSSDTIEVTFNGYPPVPDIIQTTTALEASFAFSYQWYLDGLPLAGETQQQLLNPAPGIYLVEVGNAFGCLTISDTVLVNQVEFGDFISEGFSPNGDGVNEVFFVEGIERYPGNRLLVYNRYGDLVLDRTDYANDWHGNGPGGGRLPDGSYYYVLDLNDGLAPRRGAVMINR